MTKKKKNFNNFYKFLLIPASFFLFFVFSPVGAEAASVFYSVGQTTSNLMTGTPTLTISSGTATFSVAQTGNIGVGDRVTYNTTSIAYISSKVSTSVWNVVTATGNIPTDEAVAVTVNSITREYTSLSAAEAGATDANHLNTSDLVAGDFQLNFPAYYDSGPDTAAVAVSGYTTSANNYIKIYTPNDTAAEANLSQRHQGKWDEGRYRMTPIGASALDIREDFMRIEGLQIAVVDNYSGINSGYGNTGNVTEMRVFGNIIKSDGSSANPRYGIVLDMLNSATAVSKVWNNVIYDLGKNSSSQGMYLANGSFYAHNNSVINVYTGIWTGGGTANIYNNITQDVTNGYEGSFSGDNNLSDLASDAPGANAKNSTVVQFVDAANKDFRLSENDTAARNSGVDLSADANLAFTTDIQGTARGGAWDIGADEVPVDFVSSVMQSGGDYSSLSSWEDNVESDLTVSTTRVFSGTLTGALAENNLVELYRAGADTGIDGYVVARSTVNGQILIDGIVGTSTPLVAQANDQWRLSGGTTNMWTVTGTGDALGASPRAVAKIDGAWTAAETTMLDIIGWETDQDNSIKIYTTATARHKGTDKSGYKLSGNGGVAYPAIYIRESNILVDGLVIDGNNGDGGVTRNGLIIYAGGNMGEVYISNNIISDVAAGVFSNSSSFENVYVWNNIFYDASSNGVWGSNGNLYQYVVYNNTFVRSPIDADNGLTGIRYALAKNNAVFHFGPTASHRDFLNLAAGSTNNASHDTSGNMQNLIASEQFNSIITGSEDLHLLDTSALKDAGADLTSDVYLPLTSDVDGAPRNASINAFDIGADETAILIYRSVGPSKTTALATGAANGMTISNSVATFASTDLPTNVGVGDVIQYDSDDNGSIDSLAFIHGRTDARNYTIKTVNGSSVADMGTADNDWGIYRAYTSLANAEKGVENTGINATLRNFDDWTAGGDATADDIGKDLVSANQQWNIALYANGTTADTTAVTIDGWNTGAQNHIKIYTPVNSNEVGVSQRHQGVWDDGKYRIELVDADAISVNDDLVIIDGIQISISGNTQYKEAIRGGSAASDIRVSNNIVRHMGPEGYMGINFSEFSHSRIYVWNNLAYGWATAGIQVVTVLDGDNYIYNNTVINSSIGIRSGNDFNSILKNNISYNNTDNYFGVFNNLSDYNLSGPTQSDAPGANSKNSTTVRFADALNKDFHLHPLDTAARNAGVDLLADANLPFNADIDGHTRGAQGAWDIGADEAAKFVAYSVGQSSSDLKTGTPTVTVSNGTATFSVAQTGNIGAGDRVTYNTSSIAYIASKVSQTQWNLVTATGEIPADVTTQTVNSITREYTSLSAAEAGATDVNHLNTTDLVAANVQLNFPAYYDSGADTTAVTVSGYTTGQPNYIKIYTPNNTATEVNQSQRHSGKPSTSAYRLSGMNGIPVMLNNYYVEINGIEILSWTGAGNTGLSDGYNGRYLTVANMLVHDGPANADCFNFSMGSWYSKIYNNVAFNCTKQGFNFNTGNGDSVISNNTAYNNAQGGIYNFGYGSSLRNNISQGNSVYDYSGNYNSNDYNNLSSDSTAPGTNSRKNATVQFADAANGDFHLHPDDTIARGNGVNLSSDSFYSFSTDIDGQSRKAVWDVGADQGVTKIFRSVGPGNTTALASGAGNNLTVSGATATFAAALPDNIGVGDVIQYDSDNNGSIESLAFVSKRISPATYVVSKANGDLPIATTAADQDWAIFRAHTSLSNAEAGIENTAINVALRNFDDWTAGGDATANDIGKDLVSANEQWNIATYADAADTTAVTIDGWNTGAQNYIKIYTPFSSSEVGISQRHQGKWDNNSYNITVSLAPTNWGVVSVFEEYVSFDGLQIFMNYDAQYHSGINFAYTSSSIGNQVVSNSIIKGNGGTAQNNKKGINGADQGYAKLFNNIIYAIEGTSSTGVSLSGSSSYPSYAFNNTVSGGDSGFRIWMGGSYVTLINNIYQGSGDGFYGVFSGTSDYNISSIAADAPGANSKNSATVQFIDAVNKDFHLSPLDTVARFSGLDLSANAAIPFNLDIDGQTRPAGKWDIGADQTEKNAAKIRGNVKLKPGAKIKR